MKNDGDDEKKEEDVLRPALDFKKDDDERKCASCCRYCSRKARHGMNAPRIGQKGGGTPAQPEVAMTE